MTSPLFKIGQTVFDPETNSTQVISKAKLLKIHGIRRQFYSLSTPTGHTPASRWREEHELLTRSPTLQDLNSILDL